MLGICFFNCARIRSDGMKITIIHHHLRENICWLTFSKASYKADQRFVAELFVLRGLSFFFVCACFLLVCV